MLAYYEYRSLYSIIPRNLERLFITKESQCEIMPEEEKARVFYDHIRVIILRKKCFWSLQWPRAFKTQKQEVTCARAKRALPNYLTFLKTKK